MFCPDCGKEISDSAVECPNCGRLIGRDVRGFSTSGVQIKNIVPGFRVLKDNALVFFGAIALLLINLLFLGKEMFRIEFTLFTTQSMEFGMFEEKDIVKTLLNLAYIAAAILMIVPAFTGRTWEKIHFAAGICVPLAACGWFAAMLVGAASKLGTNELMEAVDTSLTLTGSAWLFIIVNVAAIIVTVKACGEIILTQDLLNAAQYDKK